MMSLSVSSLMMTLTVTSLQLNDAHGDVESEDDGDDDELLPLAQFCYHDPSGFS